MTTIDSEKKNKKTKVWLRNTIIIVLLALATFVYIRYYYPFGVGVKAGQLNYVVHKGYVFKTYEGKLIQAGYRGGGGTIQSYEFEFSITKKEIADSLMLSGGKEVELRYKEYLGTLPWRGYSKYVVYEIVAIK